MKNKEQEQLKMAIKSRLYTFTNKAIKKAKKAVEKAILQSYVDICEEIDKEDLKIE